MKGFQDGIATYGRVCSKQSNCDECMIGQLKGQAVSCQEFMKQFPMKAASFIIEMDSGEYTYFDEYVTRFPNCNLSIDELAEFSCRKALFEGYIDCPGGDCVKCWSEQYVTDVTMSDEDLELEHKRKIDDRERDKDREKKSKPKIKELTSMFDEDD